MMKCCWISLSLVTLIAIHVTPLHSANSSAHDDLPTCKSTFTCRDCHTAAVACSYSEFPGYYDKIEEIHCPLSEPYCTMSSGTCSNKPEPALCGLKDEFTCESDGIYPDANCSIFHVCQDRQSVRVICENGAIFDQLSNACKNDAICGTFPCKTDGLARAHTIYDRFYSNCGDPPAVRSCPDGYSFNEANQSCEARCKHEGSIPDEEDCHKYFRCIEELENGKPVLVKYWRTCPALMGFDPEKRMCSLLPLNSLPTCKAETQKSPHQDEPIKQKRINPEEFADEINATKPYQCVQEGYFPTSDCREMVKCEKDFHCRLYRCRYGFVYDSSLEQCHEYADCGTYFCPNEEAKAAHSQNPAYYGYCNENKTVEIITKCPKPFELNETSQLCEMICHYEGVFQDPGNCTMYYSCKRSWLTESTSFFEKTLEHCPSGYGFDPENGFCVQLPSQAIPNCTVLTSH